MKKYIDADVLIERIEKNEDLSWNLDKVSQAAFISILNHIPAVDVEPVRKWIPCIERLPEKFEECIVAKADSKGTTGGNVRCGCMDAITRTTKNGRR